MSRLPPNIDPTVSNVHTYLGSILPDCRLDEETLDPAYQPVLLLQTRHVLAAFAFSNGDMRKSYDILYEKFKRRFTESKGAWDAFDLAFVFCVSPGAANLDEFSSSVETNVYFCRKFVVPLASPLWASLSRLPFLPLAALNGNAPRPVSAHTYLLHLGVPTELARFIVVQHERSAERIVEDCTSGKFGGPHSFSTDVNPREFIPDVPPKPIRLEAVTIENFRAYRRQQTLNFGVDVTVLYGPNGFGKTSFFDAIDFAVTGGIGRLNHSSNNPIAKTAKHLDCKDGDSIVSLALNFNGRTIPLVRNVDQPNKALFDGKNSDRKTVLTKITGAPISERIDHLVRLFRATHLFSQEQQELTKGFQPESSLQASIISQMLAFEDYVSAEAKASKVCEVLRAAIAGADKSIQSLLTQIEEEKSDLERLNQDARPQAEGQALEAETIALRGELIQAGISVPLEKADASVVRRWRATLEGRLAESQIRINRLSGLATEVASLPRLGNQINALIQQIAEREQELGAADQKQKEAGVTLQDAEKRLIELNGQAAELHARADSLAWARISFPILDQLTLKQQALRTELSQSTADLERLRKIQEKALADLQEKQRRAESIAESVKTMREQLRAVNTLLGEIPSWAANCAARAAVVYSLGDAEKTLETLREQAKELSLQISQLSADDLRLTSQIVEIENSQSELRNLLAQIQSHINSGTCPLCGTEHPSKEELLGRIANHTEKDAAASARTMVVDVRARTSALAELLAANKQKQEAASIQISEFQKQRSRLDSAIQDVIIAAEKLGFTLDANSSNPDGPLTTRRQRVEQELEKLNTQDNANVALVETAHTDLANATNLATKKASEVAIQISRKTQLDDEAGQLRRDPRLQSFSQDIDIEQLAQSERAIRAQIDLVAAETAKIQTQLAECRTQAKVLEQQARSVVEQLELGRNQLANLRGQTNGIILQLENFKLSKDVTEETLRSLIDSEASAHSRFLALRDSATSLELALDAVTTAAALTRLQENIRMREKSIAVTAEQSSKHEMWVSYFEELRRLLSAQQRDVTNNFIEEYGPRTSVIQRRLRSVYGFDDIEMHSHESSIRVRVKRHGEELRPTDYFSQSQQQTLLLGLFLTACSSQTWSAFSPVLLDDPVTHFDDLNTYAFLDLIVGLLESESWKQQYVISTCDERVLQLARQKFRHLRERARFYRFLSFGSEGPNVEELGLP